jgi:hypothetical protein
LFASLNAGILFAVQSPIRLRKGLIMPAKKSPGFAALAQLQSERAALDAREREARALAACELGEAVLDAVGAAFSPAEVVSLMKAAGERGYAATMAALGAPSPSRPKPEKGAVSDATHAAQ